MWRCVTPADADRLFRSCLDFLSASRQVVQPLRPCILLGDIHPGRVKAASGIGALRNSHQTLSATTVFQDVAKDWTEGGRRQNEKYKSMAVGEEISTDA